MIQDGLLITSKSRPSTHHAYWIIDKDFAIPKDDDKIAKAIKSHLYGTLDSLGFKEKINKFKIKEDLTCASKDY
jgi:hypothetical protein